MKPEHVELIERIFESVKSTYEGKDYFVNEYESWISVGRFEQLIAAIEAEKDKRIADLEEKLFAKQVAINNLQCMLAEMEDRLP